jgi:Xylose isomerase-like TIM barrel
VRPIGFSTGAIALSDFRAGLRTLTDKGLTAVELSALREDELAPLVDALDSLDLSSYTYVSFHAPSRFDQQHEKHVARLLEGVARRKWPIVVHPDTLVDYSVWGEFRGLLLIENMDKRNSAGRTADELHRIFERLPRAGLCFDVGHCRQVDPTMNESRLILRDFGSRLRQLHVSEVNSRSTHDPLSESAMGAFRKISHLIPRTVPVILESRLKEDEIESEIHRLKLALAATGEDGHADRNQRQLQRASR